MVTVTSTFNSEYNVCLERLTKKKKAERGRIDFQKEKDEKKNSV